MRSLLISCLLSLGLSACVFDNEINLFPKTSLADSSFTGFLAYYPFNASLVDSLKQQGPLDFIGSLEYGWGVNGDSAGALFLDGQEDYMRNFLDAGDSLALSFWIMPYPNYNSVILFEYGIGELEVGLDAISGATMPSFNLYVQSGADKQRSNYELNCFMWHHFFIEAGSPDRIPRWYINGWPIEDTLRPNPFKSRASVLFSGRKSNPDTTTHKYYRGFMDELRIFNDYLPDESIEELFWLEEQR